ncbi:alpha-1A adrenergic receptor-like [Brachionus plicatilis]|uniref:Alpha-1A adrenergic receptor-like n=1 Tax=Brachionus plicatilis TaxID=10195 RepID=A0A3M7T3T0_BRAPC|nr:alpha-1A adrenergic receptor-like [Brachionus plicatilis]
MDPQYVIKFDVIQSPLIGQLDHLSTNYQSPTTTKLSNYALYSIGFSNAELKTYSIITFLLSFVGLFVHSLVIIILVYQQAKRVILKNENKKFIKNNFSRIFGRVSSSNNLSPKTHNFEIYNNYVTYAFVFHQSVVDLFRIVYAILFANRILNQQSHTEAHEFQNHSFSVKMDLFYNDYCTHMASFYSILSMVTIVNILTILISETCRFYDLKFNSSDTSNYCCVLFGIFLIWTSSLIIISSLMLVGVADSASPTWRCDLGESESTTRSLVINIVWFFLVSFVILIAFSYSISLYRELKKLDEEDNRMSLYTVNSGEQTFKADFLERQIKISQLTIKRLRILIYLLAVFCVCFVPNFVMVILKNVIEESKVSFLRPLSLLSSIANLSNSSLNAIILLILCLKSHDTYLMNINKKLTKSQSVGSFLRKMLVPGLRKKRAKQVDEAEIPLNRQRRLSLNGIILNPNTDDCSCISNCNEECIQLKSFTTGQRLCKYVSEKTDRYEDRSRRNSSNVVNVKEFYSKVGNRLGTTNLD